MINSKNNKGLELVSLLVSTAFDAVTDIGERVSNVRYAPSDLAEKYNRECILFEFDGKTMLGILRGRCEDAVIGYRKDIDVSIAVKLLLDKNCFVYKE